MMEWGWAVDGITEKTPRTTGSECNEYMTNNRRIIEACIVTIILCIILKWAIKNLEPIVLDSNNLNDNLKSKSSLEYPSTLRLLLLITMIFVFGMEMGFKFAEKSVIFALNPCHIQTIIQIYLLAVRPSKTSIALFRIQMNFLNGPVLAYVFPEVETRLYNLEQFTYWIQHALLYLIPIYLLASGLYKSEKLLDFKWNIAGYAILLIYHFVVLNATSILSGINLNHMLCPALSDPFQGPHYRIAAIIHEGLLCPVLNKITVLLFASNYVQRIVKAAPNYQHIGSAKTE